VRSNDCDTCRTYYAESALLLFLFSESFTASFAELCLAVAFLQFSAISLSEWIASISSAFVSFSSFVSDCQEKQSHAPLDVVV